MMFSAQSRERETEWKGQRRSEKEREVGRRGETNGETDGQKLNAGFY